MSSPTLDVLAVRVDILEKDFEELSSEQKGNQKIVIDAILKNQETNAEIKEYIAQQTVHMQVLQQHVIKQDQQLAKMDEKLDQVNLDVQAIKVRREHEEEPNGDRFGNFISENGKPLIWVIILFLLVILAVLGFSAEDLSKLFV